MKEYLTYDDVQILPKYSEVKHRADCNTSTSVTKNYKLDIPIVSSPMDTVTEYEMAYQMSKLGGMGIIHRFLSIEEQSKMVDELNIQADVSGKSEDVPVEQKQDVQSDRPEWLPEKFKSAEELAKSYTELEKSYSEKSQATANDLNPFFDELMT